MLGSTKYEDFNSQQSFPKLDIHLVNHQVSLLKASSSQQSSPELDVHLLNLQITCIDEVIAPTKRNYVLGGICIAASHASIKVLSVIPSIDSEFVETRLDHVRTYYELLHLPFEINSNQSSVLFIVLLSSIREEEIHNENANIPPPVPPTQQTLHTLLTIKLPILKKSEYDIWAMKMKHYLGHTDYPIWEVIQKENGQVQVLTDTNGQIRVLPPKTAE
ncbi:hypothetical protein Tco_0596842 [Tanacetum coccineum]